MPIHDWTTVPDGIFHAFHHAWIAEIARELNSHILPNTLYALPEQVAGGFGPDVLTLQSESAEPSDDSGSGTVTATRILQPRPLNQLTAQSESEFYRRKKNRIAIRHVSGDRVIAMIEIVSPGNKASNNAIRTFVNKVCELLEAKIHVLILDPFPPGTRDPNGVHGLVWSEIADSLYVQPADKPLLLVAYESDTITRAYCESVAVTDVLPDMPLFVEPNGCVMVPLESTYNAAFAAQPRRWREVLEPPQ
jgi:hypothetical protein